MSGTKKIFFSNLDGLRFIAFFMVFLSHTVSTPFELMNVDNIYLVNFVGVVANGHIGVSIFFVLSGFLITYLILSEIQLNGRLDIIKFYIRRTLRIWPLYFLLLILSLVAFPVFMRLLHQNWPYDMNPLYYFIFLSNFDVLRVSLNGGNMLFAVTITWSVAIEEQFYVLWPILFTFLNKQLYKYIFPALIVLCYTFRYLNAGNHLILFYHTLSVCGDLAIGGFAAFLSFNSKQFVDFFKNQSNKSRIIFYGIGVALLYAFQFSTHPLIEIFSRLISTAFFCYVILDQNFSQQSKWKLGSSRFMSFWGKYTYGLYLWHVFVLMVCTIIVSKLFHFSLDLIGVHLLLLIMDFIFTFLVSYYSYKWFESRFLKLKDRFSFIHKS